MKLSTVVTESTPSSPYSWTEQIARDLYGPSRNSKIDDIPLVFFQGYAIGEPIQ